MSDPTGIPRARQQLYRWLKYRITAPAAPRLPEILQGKNAVIVGSAPFSTRPAGWDQTYRVVSINASQMAARAWLHEVPAVTLMQYNQIEGTSPTAVEVRRVLRGQRTGALFLLLWRHDLERAQRGLAAFEYGYDTLQLIGRYERVALMHKVTGRLNLEIEVDTKWSNGIIAAALALHSGARHVILTGINPQSQGHAYNQLGLPRKHSASDMEALQLFRQQGHPVFTADPEVARATGLPLWEGR
jgi:hypothetical protein